MNTESATTNSKLKTQNSKLIKQYLELTKPRVVLLMIITAIVGMLLATKNFDLALFIYCNLGIALMAGSAACINHLVDSKIDKKMQRTANRPIATGSISKSNAVIFATIIGCLGFYLIYEYGNPLAAYLTFASLIGYAYVYTVFLKRASPQNIVIGGLAGATPPLLGWVCVTGAIDAEGLLLALIIFIWTPPHFWALALYRIDDYRKAEIPMLPNTHGLKYTKIQIVCYCVLLLIVSLLPWLLQMFDWLYLLAAIVLGLRFLAYSIKIVISKTEDPRLYFKTFKFSIWYLGFLFGAMLVDFYWL